MEENVRGDEMSPPRHECKKCHVQERHTADGDDYDSFISPTISGEYPGYFWMTSFDEDSICLRSVISTESDVIKF